MVFFQGLAGDVTRLSADKRFIFKRGVGFGLPSQLVSGLLGIRGLIHGVGLTSDY